MHSWFYRLFAAIFLVFASAHVGAVTKLYEQNYEVYYQDISSVEYGLDGYPDILLKVVPNYVPLGTGVVFPIPLNSGYQTLLFCGTSSGDFVPCTLASNAELPDEVTGDYDFLIGDFDGDHALDIVLHSKNASRNTIYLNNNKDGTFSLKDQFTEIDGHLVSGNPDIDVTDNIGAKGAEITIDGERYAEAHGGQFEEARRINLAYSLVGASQSSFSVSKGQANFSIPIQVASGGAGVTPNVSLNYSSNGDYGQAGMGFQISGLPRVKRCGRNNLQDGYVQVADGSNQDLACLNGGRLILVSGTYWQSGSEYRLEQEDSSRVVFENGGFTQYKKDGDIYRYGQSEASRVRGIRANSAVAVWALESVSDRLGYGYRISYLPDRAAIFPETIEYTVQAGSAQAGYAQVEFHYETDPYQKKTPIFGKLNRPGYRGGSSI